MSEYINKQDLFPNGVYYVNGDNPMASLDELINRIHSLSTVSIVRCKNCVWFHKKRTYGFCDRPREDVVVRVPDDFCSRGLKRED